MLAGTARVLDHQSMGHMDAEAMRKRIFDKENKNIDDVVGMRDWLDGWWIVRQFES